MSLQSGIDGIDSMGVRGPPELSPTDHILITDSHEQARTTRAREPGREAVVKLASWIVITLGFAAVAWVAWNVATRWQEIEVANVLRELLLPFWLTPIALLFVYALALLVGYEQAFARIDCKAGERSSWRQKLALLSVADIQLKDLRRISGLAQLQIAEETTFKGARRVAARAIKE